MLVTKFLENRMTIDGEISEKHAILVDHLSFTSFRRDFAQVWV